MKKNEHMILIHKFLTRTIDQREKERLRRWLESPGNERIFHEVKTIWENAEEGLEPIPEEKKKIERIKLLTRLKEVKKQESKITKFRNKIRLTNFAMVGMIILTGFLGYLLISMQESFPETTFIAADGQNKAILPDSSVIQINKESTISFTNSSRERRVALLGEAYFQVTENKDKPFIVHAGQTIIQVTGTSFVVKAYQDSPLQVILISGHVNVIYKDKTISLVHENDMAVVQEKLIKSENVDPNFNSWYTKKFYFDNLELQKILDLFEEHFEVSFDVDDSALLRCRFSGRFQNDDSLDGILKVLAFSLDFSYEQNGSNYKIYGTGCKRAIN